MSALTRREHLSFRMGFAGSVPPLPTGSFVSRDRFVFLCLIYFEGLPLATQAPPPAPSKTAMAYARQVFALLPTGPAWPREAGTWLYRFVQGFVEEFARVHARVEDLLREMDPRTTIELIGEWETMVGLPDPCITAPQTLQARRDAVVAQLTTVNGQNEAYYINLAAGIGYTITITYPALHTWRVNAPETTVRWARAGVAVAGDRVREWGNDVLECAISHRKPSHTVLEFAYGS